MQPLLPPPSDGAPIETFYRSDDEWNAIAERIDEARRLINARSREEWERMVDDRDQELHRAEGAIICLKKELDAARLRIADFEVGAIGARRQDAT